MLPVQLDVNMALFFLSKTIELQKHGFMEIQNHEFLNKFMELWIYHDFKVILSQFNCKIHYLFVWALPLELP